MDVIEDESANSVMEVDAGDDEEEEDEAENTEGGKVR